MKQINLTKTMLIGLLSVIMMLCMGCTQTKIQMAVAAANKECPMSEDGMTVTSITYENNTIFYNCVFDDTDVNADDIKQISDYIKSLMINELITDNEPESKELIASVLDANANIVYRFTDRLNNKVEILIAPHELKRAMDSYKANGKNDNLDDIITFYNSILGDDVSCHKEGRNVVIVYEPGSYDGTMKYIKNNKKTIKNNILSEVDQDDALSVYCAENNIDLIFRYKDNRDNSADVRITSSELRNVLGI